jgi:hypothetical protein
MILQFRNCQRELHMHLHVKTCMNINRWSNSGIGMNDQEFLVIACLSNSGIAKRNCICISMLRHAWIPTDGAIPELAGIARNDLEFLVIACLSNSGITKRNCIFISTLRHAWISTDEAIPELAGIARNMMPLIGIECKEFRNWMGWIPELNDGQFGGASDSGMCNFPE